MIPIPKIIIELKENIPVLQSQSNGMEQQMNLMFVVNILQTNLLCYKLYKYLVYTLGVQYIRLDDK